MLAFMAGIYEHAYILNIFAFIDYRNKCDNDTLNFNVSLAQE
jgi:hypothetical protein